jgi:hypothetical protein
MPAARPIARNNQAAKYHGLCAASFNWIIVYLLFELGLRPPNKSKYPSATAPTGDSLKSLSLYAVASFFRPTFVSQGPHQKGGEKSL